MSKFIPDPQIVHLRAMRRGDIAVAIPSPGTMTVGVTGAGVPSPEGLRSIALSAATPATNGPDATPSIDLVNGSFVIFDAADSFTLTQDVNQSVDLSSGGSFPEIFFELVTLSGTPEEFLDTGGSSPALTVTFQTSVV